MMTEYRVDAASYLSRARKLLQSEERDKLFYAAFELRCCIESRQMEYADAQKNYRKKKKLNAWKISETNRELERVFRAKKIALISLKVDGSGFKYDCYYTPVSTDMVKSAEKILHQLLHCTPYELTKRESWWIETKDHLLAIYRDAWVSCRGNMLAPPLLNRQTNLMEFSILLDGTGDDFCVPLPVAGAKLTIEVKYLDEPPSGWTPDL